METISRDNSGLGEVEKKQPKGDLEGVSVETQRAQSVRNNGCFLGTARNPWTGWERGESHVSSALLLSLPKLDVSYREAQANELDLSSLVQIQVSSA